MAAGSGGGGGTLASPYKAYAAGTPAPPGAYGEGGKGANIQVPAAYMPFYQEASQRTGIPVDVLIAQHRQESGFNPNATGSAGEIGIGQVMPSTALAPGYGMAPLGTNADAVRTALRDPRTNINFSADYLKARLPQGANPSDPEAIRRALVNYNGGGDPNYVANVTRYLPPPAAVAQAAAAPQPAAGVAARTGGVDVAGPGAGAPSAAPAADLVGPRPMPPTGAGAPVATPSSIANTPVVPTGPGINPVLAGQPAATALSPQNALAPPATPPQAAAPATGTNSPQFQAALALQNQALELETRFPGNPQAKAAAAALRQRAALYMQADSVSYDPESGIGTKAITGERLNAATPNAHYVWDDKQGAYVDLSGTHPPVTPPSPRLTQTPGGQILQSKPGGGATIVFTADPKAVATQAAAQSEGAASGTATAQQLPKLADQGRASAQAIGNIDYGMNQLREATKGGIPSGYFSGALANAAAAAKSLGIDTSALGVDPKAVGNIQSAQKTLAVVSGAILQQVLGGNSDITDAKLQHFIHAQPGIETDPQAVERVLNWARSQFVYEREMSAAGMKEAAKPENGGRLPTGWQARYFDQHGFAPIYNPGTGEMQQPEGAAPSREPPASVKPEATTAPVNPAARKVGETYQTPKGPLKWTGSGWVP